MNCTTFTPNNSLSVTITGTTTASNVNLSGMNGSQSVTFNGLVNVSTTFLNSAAAYSVAFNQGGAVTPFTNFMNTGGVTFGNSATSAITFTNGVDTEFPGVTTTTFGLIQSTTGPMTFGPVSLAGATSIKSSSQPISFASTLNGAYDLTVADPAGTVTFTGLVGGTAPLRSLTVTAGAIDLTTNITASGGAVALNGPVTLLGPVQIQDTSGGISFGSTIDGAYALTLNALSQGSVSVAGAIGGTTALTGLTATAANKATFSSTINTSGASGFSAGNIAISTGGNVFCSGSLTALGGASIGASGFNGGTVAILSTGGSVTVNQINVSGGSGASFTGGNAGSISLQPSTSYSSGSLGNLPQGILGVYGNLTALGGSGSASGSAGTVSLSPAGRSTTMSIATITGNPAGSDLTIQAGNLFIGSNEAMTVLGNVNITAQNTAAVGDLVALNSISITAPTIELIRHGEGLILDYRGILYPNPTVHLIAGDPTLTGTITTTGTGGSPLIGTVNFSNAFFRELLFYGSLVLNWDGAFFPQSGIIDWVVRTDLWDTLPLNRWRSVKQWLAERIELVIESKLPHHKDPWIWIKQRKKQPIDESINHYLASKKLQEGEISIPDFERFLAHSLDEQDTKKYIETLQKLLLKSEPPARNEWSFFPRTKKQERSFNEEMVEFKYFNEDVLEYTKPASIRLQQWRQLVQTYSITHEPRPKGRGMVWEGVQAPPKFGSE